MRHLGVVFVFLGLVALAVGSFTGLRALFGWNGRHSIEAVTLTEGANERRLAPRPGRRYTLSVQVVFDRSELEEHEGLTSVEAKLPLVARVTDGAGTRLAQAIGWIDPSEPPNVLYGRSAPPTRGGRPELVVERLIGPFATSSDAPLRVEVDLGADRVGRAPILERRLIVYDDERPPSLRNGVLAAVGGVGFLLGGIVLLVVSSLGRRKVPRKRGCVSAGNVV